MSRKPFLEAIRIMAAVAWADGTMGKEEADMLRQMIEVGPLTPDERAFARGWLHNRPDADADSLQLSEEARVNIFRTAVRVAAADGRTVRAERDMLADLAKELSLPDRLAREVRDAIRDEQAARLPAHAKLYRLPIHTLAGELISLGSYKDRALLLVNVASECGLTPQYAQLQALHQKYADRGLTIIAFPCNQFGAQEPGTPEQIEQFCTANYGVSFPMMEKVDVKGDQQHDIYQLLSEIPDAAGQAGEVQWNFEKFVVSADGNTITRFRPKIVPDAPEVIAAIEAGLPS